MALTLAQQEPFLGSGVAQATRFFMSFLAQHRTARAVPLPKSMALGASPRLQHFAALRLVAKTQIQPRRYFNRTGR